MKTLLAGMAWLDARAAELAGVAMFVMVGCVGVDVLLRYSFNAPLAWSYDLVSMYLLPAVVFLPMAWVQKHRHHVNVDILYRRFPPRWQRLATVLSLVVCGAVVAAIAALAAGKAWTSLTRGEVVSGPIAWPAWIGSALLALGGFVFVLRALVDLAATLAGHPWPGETQEDAIKAAERDL